MQVFLKKMNIFRGYCFITGLLVLLFCGAFNTETFATGNDDLKLLDEFDNSKAGGGQEKDNLLKQIYKHVSGSMGARYFYFFDKVEKDDNSTKSEDGQHFTDIILRFSDFIEQKYWKLDMSGWAENGNQKDTYEGVVHWLQDNERKRRYLEINELFLSIFTKYSDFVAGKRIFVNGTSTLYSPANRYSPYDLNDPTYTKQLGIWQAGFNFYFLGLTFSGYMLPVYQASKSPSEKSRWAATWVDQRVIGNMKIIDDYPEVNKDNISYLCRLKGTFKGWDLFATYYYGNNTNPVLKQELEGTDIVYIKKISKVYNVSSGFSTTFGKLELHGEGIYNYTFESKDDTYIDYVAGFTYTIDEYAKKVFLDKIDVTIEYAREKVLKEMTAAGYYESSEDLRIVKNNILISARIKINEDWNISYLFQYGLKNKEIYNRGKIEYRIIPGLKMNVIAEFFNGSENNYYGKLDNDDRLIICSEYSF